MPQTGAPSDIAQNSSSENRRVDRAHRPISDTLYRTCITACASVIPALLILLAIVIVVAAWPAIITARSEIVFGSNWDVAHNHFGALPALIGTLASSFIALLIATPLALGCAILCAELAPRWLRAPVSYLIDLLAAIPSVVYGLWGLFVVVPFMRETFMPFVQHTLKLGSIPIFAGAPYGPSLFAAAIVLAIMILPYIASVSREVLSAVPQSQREAALALGATRWEMVRDAVLPFARSGLVGGVMLGLGRALGETMAVTMVIGNRNAVPGSLFDPAYTVASLLANEFVEASTALHVSALMAAAGALLLVTMLVNGLARWLVLRTQHFASDE
ncbi:MAG: phosphate ABC transporter permease subunit PstC [Gemmatimonadaceae bacterium]